MPPDRTVSREPAGGRWIREQTSQPLRRNRNLVILGERYVHDRTSELITPALELDQHEDIELVAQARNGDERAIEVLLVRYRNFARSKARTYFLAGSEKEDVVQEGMIGLFKAIRDFDLRQETPFRAFAELCIARQILTAIKSANRQKHQPLNSSVSIDAPAHGEEDAGSLGDFLKSPEQTNDPAELVISAEEIEALRTSMSRNLTELEGDVLALYMEGKSYEEIAGALDDHVKSIDNALQRIKRKLQHHISQREVTD